MQPDYDDLDDLEEGGFNWMLVTVLLLAVAGFFSLAWYAYQTGAQHGENGDVLVIQADPSSVRSKPDDAGGRSFPNQEKTIYNAVNGTSGDAVEIHLRPEADAPKMADDQISADEKVAELLQRAVREAQNQPAPKPKPEAVVAPKAPVAVKAKPTPKSAPVADVPQVAGSGERVQLGAFRSNAEAEKHWQKLARANGDLLKGKPHQVVRADLGAKGVFYRLRVAGFNDKDAAKALCKQLSSRGQGCFVVQ